MISGGRILWNAIAICEMSKSSWQTGKLRMNEDLVNRSKDQLFHLAHGGIPPKFRARQSETSSIRKESTTRNLSRISFDRGENLERSYSDCWYWRIRKVERIRNLSQKTKCKRSPDNSQRLRLCISCGWWFSNIIRKRLRIPRTHSKTGAHRKEREPRRKIARR